MIETTLKEFKTYDFSRWARLASGDWLCGLCAVYCLARLWEGITTGRIPDCSVPITGFSGFQMDLMSNFHLAHYQGR